MGGDRVNSEKILKMLLLKMNKNGFNCSLVKDMKYSQEFGSVYSRYTLCFWFQDRRIDKKTGEMKDCWSVRKHEFLSSAELMKYMAEVANGKEDSQ